MKQSERRCSVHGCDNPGPRDYPLCWSCWRLVPKDLRGPVREELAKRGTPDFDGSALYYAVTAAAAAVQAPIRDGDSSWERAYRAAGSPELGGNE